jgi:predicted Fe-Mo cluster-binding NifX family protein
MKILITILDNFVAPRFDLASEVLIALCENEQVLGTPRTILMTRPSAEELCSLIIKEGINVVICGGIEESHLQYLSWKKIQVTDSVIGPYSEALQAINAGFLKPGTILPGARQREDAR